MHNWDGKHLLTLVTVQGYKFGQFYNPPCHCCDRIRIHVYYYYYYYYENVAHDISVDAPATSCLNHDNLIMRTDCMWHILTSEMFFPIQIVKIKSIAILTKYIIVKLLKYYVSYLLSNGNAYALYIIQWI